MTIAEAIQYASVPARSLYWAIEHKQLKTHVKIKPSGRPVLATTKEAVDIWKATYYKSRPRSTK